MKSTITPVNLYNLCLLHKTNGNILPGLKQSATTGKYNAPKFSKKITETIIFFLPKKGDVN